MFDKPVVYVDIETSGSNWQRSHIIEIAAIRVEAGEVVDEYKTLLNPGTPLPFWITKLTGITDGDLVDAPFFEDIAHELKTVLDGAIFIAHNVRFDYSYIKRQLESSGYKYNPDLLCTVRLSRALYPQNKGHSLEKIIARHNIEVESRHRAYADTKAIMDFADLAYKEHGHEAFHQAVSKQLKTKSLPPNLDEAYMKDVKNTPGVYVFENEFGQAVYVGKSVNLRSRVLSHFNADNKFSKEMKISQNTHKLRVIETGDELEALLLESKMIKDLLPVHNRKLRRNKSHAVIVKNQNEQGYTTLSVETKDIAEFAEMERIYGVYTSQGKAKSALEDKRKTYGLCSKLLNLEGGKGACFMYQLGKCKGACVGKESAALYNTRIEIALNRSKMESWPYKSAVVINTGGERSIVVDKWIVVGYIQNVEEGEPYFKKIARSFEIDTYRILRSFIKTHAKSLSIMPVELSSLAT